jgi:hypothetical protein
MGWHIQTFKLNLTSTVVEGDAEGPRCSWVWKWTAPLLVLGHLGEDDAG